jgi:hypothetical protein
MVAVYVEVPEELDREFRAMIERVGLGGVADHIRLAMRRHLASPPSVEVPLLPHAGVPTPDPAPAAKSKAARKPRR